MEREGGWGSRSAAEPTAQEASSRSRAGLAMRGRGIFVREYSVQSSLGECFTRSLRRELAFLESTKVRQR